jgi:hypothetical protein
MARNATSQAPAFSASNIFLEADEFDRHADTLAEFSPQIGRHAMKRSTGRVSPRQYRIGIVDADAQCARRRKIIL